MSRVDRNSRLTMEFVVTWNGETARHEERLYAEKVSVWRDLFPGTLAERLQGMAAGDTVTEVIAREEFFAPREQRLLRTVKRQQFVPPPGHRQLDSGPLPGRFYPQNYLHRVPGVYDVSTAPCRFLEEQRGELLFDLNHPLAGRELTLSATIIAIDSIRVERGGRCEAWLEPISNHGPGMQERSPCGPTAFYYGQPFRRQDERSDGIFYGMPRLVQHLDDCALRIISAEYGRLLPSGGNILDLMGSWDSHLPEGATVRSLTVLGMNEEELRKNRRADGFVVHDLNLQPSLPLADSSFDAVFNTAAIEYAVDPHLLCREIARVLRPGGVVAIAFSNRWFESKAIALWGELHEFERVGLVVDLLESTKCFEDIKTLSVRGYPRPEHDPRPLPLSDPVFMVTARKNEDPEGFPAISI
jgi:FKBP-type peptidyl-prolyl cis-trans isomerase 2